MWMIWWLKGFLSMNWKIWRVVVSCIEKSSRLTIQINNHRVLKKNKRNNQRCQIRDLGMSKKNKRNNQRTNSQIRNLQPNNSYSSKD